jgi:hypothetical protein
LRPPSVQHPSAPDDRQLFGGIQEKEKSEVRSQNFGLRIWGTLNSEPQNRNSSLFEWIPDALDLRQSKALLEMVLSYGELTVPCRTGLLRELPNRLILANRDGEDLCLDHTISYISIKMM